MGTGSEKPKVKLFFFDSQRRPKRTIPPDTEADQIKRIKQGFIVEDDLIGKIGDEYEALKTSPQFVDNVKKLREYLIPAYLESSYKAKTAQNDYMWYQWALILGSFVTALVATVAIGFNTSPPNNLPAEAAPLVETTPETNAASQAVTLISTQGANSNIIIVKFMSALTLCVGALTTYFTFVQRRDKPHLNWYRARRVTEELRRHYFLFLMQMAPYSESDRVKTLRKNVLEIKKEMDKELGEASL